MDCPELKDRLFKQFALIGKALSSPQWQAAGLPVETSARPASPHSRGRKSS